MKTLILLAGCAGVAAVSPPAPAQTANYPVKPVRIVLGFAPGGGVDILTRMLGPRLGEALGQPIVVDNRPGAAGNIAVEHVVKSPADGYTLLMGTPGLAISPSLYSKLAYDPNRDLAAVSMVGTVANLLVVHPSVPAESVKQLIALAKAQPGKLNYASPGKGTSLHLAAELFRYMAGVDLVHIVYKGGAPAVADLIGGHVDLMFDVLPSSMPHVNSGKLKALAITAETRSPLLPRVPTIAESALPGYVAITWNGILAPAATPKEIVAKLNAAIGQVVRSTEIRERLAAIATDPVTNSPEQFQAFIRTETGKWADLIKRTGISLD